MAKTKDKIKKLFKPFKKLKKVFSNSSSKSDVSSALDVEKSFYNNNPNEQRGVMEEHLDNEQRMHFGQELVGPLEVSQVPFQETSNGELGESSESDSIKYKSLEELLPPPRSRLKILLNKIGAKPGPKLAPGQARADLRKYLDSLDRKQTQESRNKNRYFQGNILTEYGKKQFESNLNKDNIKFGVIPGFHYGDFSTPGTDLNSNHENIHINPELDNNEINTMSQNKAGPSTLNKVPKRK